MRLSMWILADWLEDLHPTITIESTSYALQNARIKQGTTNLRPFTVYVSHSEQGGTLCVNGNDSIYIPEAAPEFVLNKILDAFEFYNDWEYEVMKLIDRGCTLDELLGKGCMQFYKRLMVADASFRAISCVENVAGRLDFTKRYDDLSLDSLVKINALPEIRRKNLAPYPLPFTIDEGVVCYNRNLYINDTHQGWLVDFEDRCLTPGQIHGLDIFGNFVEHWLSVNATIEQSQQQSRILLDIISGDYSDRNELIKALNATGWFDTDEKFVYCFVPSQQSNSHADFILEKSLSDISHEANILRHEGKVYMVINTSITDVKSLEQALIPLLKKTGNVAGKSVSFYNIFDLRHFLDIANVASGFARVRGIELADFHDAVVPYTLHTLEKNLAVDVCHPAIYKLVEYDRLNDGKLYETLKVWLEAERNYTKTAQTLYIHRSTLLYRIDRIKEITELDFDDPEVRFHLMISLALYERRR